MKFTLFKTSDPDVREIIEINTLEELKDLQEKYQYELVIALANINEELYRYIYPESDGHYIEIYDDYRE